ncbi:MAG: hypothetical protein KUG78_14535 [Kangiellaceae bacterium]|nr:hypothetical protein [Kangiellaceae bacterium]
MTQNAANYAAKKAMNKAVLSVLGEDNTLYMPVHQRKPNTPKIPLFVARREELDKLNKQIFLLKKKLEHVKNNIGSWAKTFIAEMFDISEKRAGEIAPVIDEIEIMEPDLANELDDIVGEIEELKEEAPPQAKISNKRKRKRRRRSP